MKRLWEALAERRALARRPYGVCVSAKARLAAHLIRPAKMRVGARRTALRAGGFPGACVGWPYSGLTAAPPAGGSDGVSDPRNGRVSPSTLLDPRPGDDRRR